MLRPIVLCVVFSGCGFQSKAASSGGALDAADAADPPTIDGATDGSSSVTDCFGHWRDGTVTVSSVQVLPNQATNDGERDPWVSADGLTLYYARDPNGMGNKSDIYIATRTSVAQPFGNGTPVTNLNSTETDGRASLTTDQLLLVLSSDRGGQFDIYLSTRPDMNTPFGTGDKRTLGNIDTPAVQHFDPFLTRDGLKLYLAPIPATQSQRIFVATRASIADDFGTAAPVPVIASPNAANVDADPALSLDERIIVFTSNRPTGHPGTGGNNLWYATRQDPAQDFGAPRPIPTVNGDSQDADPMLSADGCELYFASTRAGKSYDLYSAQIAK